jgi:DNA-binding SARP family transcriptional activator/streptogramin lyase
MAIEIRLLGPLEALVDGERVDLGSPQQRTLLAVLALHVGTPVRLAAIERVLWGETPPQSATKVVQTYVSRLRKVLGPDAIESVQQGYLLDAGIDVDAREFRRLVDQRCLPDALELWRGAALADVPALAADARQLDELRVTAIEDRMDAELERGEGPALVAELELLVAAHPTRERLLGQLVLALYRSGRQADALAAYRSGRDTLVQELGLEPGESLRELERRILRQDPALLATPAAAPHAPPSRRRRPRKVVVLAFALVAAAALATAVSEISFGHDSPAVVPIQANRLLELDPSTNRIVGSIPIARDAAALAATPDAVWVASERERTVSRVDLRTDRVTTIGEPHPVAFLAHDDRDNIYASGWDFPFVWQIDPHTVQIVRSYRVRTRALGLSAGGGSLWVADRLANAVTRIDLAERRVADTIKVGLDPLASAFGYGALWVADGDSGTVAVIRPGASKPTIVRGIPSPYGIAAAAGGVWVASNGMHAVYRIDPDTHTVVKRIDLGTPTDFLFGVSAGPHGVWAVENHHVVRIDPRTDRVVTRIPFPPGTEPKAVTSTRKLVWITVGNPRDDIPAVTGATTELDRAAAGTGSSVVLEATLSGPYLHTTATGRGTATITFGATRACWRFTYSGIDTPDISGIHVVPPPPAGYHKLSVFPFTATTSQTPACEKLDRWGSLGPSWAKKIAAHPNNFYVIIGTGRYPNGAIGGALHRA